MAKENGEAEVRMRCPRRLADLLGGAAFRAELVVSRAERSTLDEGALVPPVDFPMTDQDRKNLDGLLALYEAGDAGDQGSKLSPPEAPPGPVGAWSKRKRRG